MRWLIYIPIFLIFSIVSPLRSQTVWHPATILLEGKSLDKLHELGIALDHGHYHPGISFDGDFTTSEIETMRKAGFKVELSSTHEIESRGAPDNCETQMENIPVYPLPNYYQFGSMGGFLNLAEMYENLDSMQARYPHLISIKKGISNYKTKGNNRIYSVKISDNPALDENEPEVLYTALHHAREPLSMSQMMFFMWHLLENYSQDTLIKKLVDNRELFFVPCVNPDGYQFNESTDPQGGGMWRKNRNPNPDGSIGTDLNRNYEEGWAFDNDGSSPIGTSETYRGVEAFSEIETKALREFCENRFFSIAMNYHSHGSKLIIPWGYLDKPTADSSHYLSMAVNMTRYNQFEIGTSLKTLSYKVNGVADDWMYGEQIYKNKIFAFTPEVGYSFWPDRKDIIRLNQSTQYMNFMAAWNAGECAHVKEISPVSISADTNYLHFEITRTGIKPAPIEITYKSDKSYIRFLSNSLIYSINPGETKLASVAYVIEGNPKKGDSISFSISLHTGYYSEAVKIKKAYTGNPNWSEEFSDVKEWFSPELSPWILTDETYVTPPECLTDSPLTPMDPNTSKIFQNSRAIDLRNAHYAFLKFNAKWQMAEDGDFAQIRVADNTLIFQSLCGRYTKEGTSSQRYAEPVYCGKQSEWVSEWINLQDYLGKVIFLQVYIKTLENSENNDGYYIDDLEVFTDLTTQVIDQNEDWHAEIFPQPAHDNINIHLNENYYVANLKLQMLSASGKQQKVEPIIENNTLTFETSKLVPGVYFLSLQFKDEKPKLYKVIIQ